MKTTYPNNRYTSFTRLGVLALSVGVAAVLTGCGDSSDTAVTAVDPTPDTTLDALFVDRAPDGAISVIESRQAAQVGATVTVIGRVAGSEVPFSNYYATLVLADASLTTCEQRPEDGCETPWDACCVTPETIADSRISVQIVGEEGRPVGRSLKGVNGLSELDTLVVTGTIADGSTADNIILNATAIYRQDRPGS